LLILNTVEEVKSLRLSDTALTIGSFDGVHKGHQHLIEVLKQQNRPTAVLTFDPHPEKVLSSQPPPRIFSKLDQENVFKTLDIDYLFFIPFDKNIAQLEATDFARQYIFELFKPSFIAVGYDFVFGKKRSGDFDLLAKLGTVSGTKVLQVPPLKVDEHIVSSSLIRKCVQGGDMELATKLLGRPFYISGTVGKGQQLGRQLGFPTANIVHSGELAPGLGIYFCTVSLDGKTYRGACSVGINPTVSNTHDVKIEVYILDFSEDIYGQKLQLFFHKKIRDELRFDSLEALKIQIQKDVEIVRNLSF